MLLKAEATSAASIRCVCLISNTEIKRSISVCLNWIEKRLQQDWILCVCVCLCCNLCIRWLVGGRMDGFECVWICACICLLIELGVLKGLRGVCNRVCSSSTPVAARRRLIVYRCWSVFDVEYPPFPRLSNTCCITNVHVCKKEEGREGGKMVKTHWKSLLSLQKCLLIKRKIYETVREFVKYWSWLKYPTISFKNGIIAVLVFFNQYWSSDSFVTYCFLDLQIDLQYVKLLTYRLMVNIWSELTIMCASWIIWRSITVGVGMWKKKWYKGFWNNYPSWSFFSQTLLLLLHSISSFSPTHCQDKELIKFSVFILLFLFVFFLFFL